MGTYTPFIGLHETRATGSTKALPEVAGALLDHVEITKGRVAAVWFIPAIERLPAMASVTVNHEPGGGRTHDIHLKRVLLYH